MNKQQVLLRADIKYDELTSEEKINLDLISFRTAVSYAQNFYYENKCCELSEYCEKKSKDYLKTLINRYSKAEIECSFYDTVKSELNRFMSTQTPDVLQKQINKIISKTLKQILDTTDLTVSTGKL